MSAPRTRASTNPWLIAVLTAGFGVYAGLAAAGGSGPFAGLHGRPAQHLVGGQLRGAPIDAGSLFTPPPRPVVTHTVDIYDPPPAPPARPAMAPPPTAAVPGATPPPAVLPTPTPTDPGDGGPDG